MLLCGLCRHIFFFVHMNKSMWFISVSKSRCAYDFTMYDPQITHMCVRVQSFFFGTVTLTVLMSAALLVCLLNLLWRFLSVKEGKTVLRFVGRFPLPPPLSRSPSFFPSLLRTRSLSPWCVCVCVCVVSGECLMLYM